MMKIEIKQNDLTVIKEACEYASQQLEQAGRAYDSIIAICDLIHPGLRAIATGNENYFKADVKRLRSIVEDRENTIYSSMMVFQNMDDLAMDIDEKTAHIGEAIEDISNAINRVNVDGNPVNNGVNDVLTGEN
ncbi:hypothetical protein ACFP1L_05005 [Lactiplantibacillus nangangensis]|uniref:Uncharacterized protein n=1 Tax=Lactiplantibacillus nangangensis TaxID=2559917 RepID=A0ABW1SIC2_9LACO|nr:hypothetical protein [Lactiplantibacillus nangangensis]